ncbi:MAG: hypothetical protein MJZ90_09745 [Bacteroidales bacterium]|nr:hypothetical protein [Bacteroidales bacterium]
MFILLITLTLDGVTAQNPLDIVKEYSIDTTKINEVVLKKVEMNSNVEKRNDFRVFVCYYFRDDRHHEKEDYLDYSFINGMNFVYECRRLIGGPRKIVQHHKFKKIHNTSRYAKQKTKSILKTKWFTVTNSRGIIHGCGNFGDVFCKVPVRDRLVYVWSDPTAFLFTHQLDCLFYVDDHIARGLPNNQNCYLYGVNLKENRIYVVVDTRWGSEMFPLEEIVNNHWEDFQGGLIMLYDEVQKRKEQEYRLNPE